MENNKIATAVTKGLIISLILIVMDLIAGFAHVKFETWYKWLPSLVLVVSIIYSCIIYGKQNQDNVTFGNVFADGFKTSAVVACLMVVFTVLSIYVISPETKDIVLDQARKQMEEKGNVPPETIDQALQMTSKFFVPFAIGGALIGTIIVGAISALIGAAVTKKNPQSPFQNQA
jgi:uncharacterized membrane protein YciS (DUF1049 family)